MNHAIRLPEVPDDEPREIIDPRDVPVRFSNLKRMAQSPLHYWEAVQERMDETLAMRLGAGVHAMLFDQPWIMFTGKVRNGKVWDAFEAEHADNKVILNRKETEHARAVVAAIRNHGFARELLTDKSGVVEQPIDWAFMGRACRSTPDIRIRNGSTTVELKTSKCSEPSKFQRDGTWRAYHAQLAFYGDAVRASRLGTASDAYIVAVESAPPYPITVLRLTEQAINQGRKLCRLWFERLLACEAANHWPPYVECVVDFDVEDTEFTLRIGGEDVEF